MKKLVILSAVAFLLNPLALFAQGANGKKPEDAFSADYDTLIRKALESFPEVPGAAIVVIKDDKPIFLRAYGLANKEAGLKADKDTLFYIASSTKSFTALAAALLEKEGKIKLDDPLTKYAAGIEFKTAIPEKVTVRDLLTHTSGLQNSPMVFRMAFSGEAEHEDMLRVFADITTYDEARYGKYAYSNLGYNIYGLLLRQKLNMKWQDLLQEKVFDPLKMRHTTAYPSKARAAKMKVAASYIFSPDTGTVIPAPLAKQDNNMQSAGGMMASASNLGRWLRLNMNGGKLDGKQAIPKEIMESLHKGYTQTTREAPPFTGNGEYGLGWQIGKYAGEKVIYHHGGFPGWSSHISFMPDKKIGVAVVVNESTAGSSLGHLLATYSYDWWLDTADREAAYAKQLENGLSGYGRMKQSQQAAFRERAKRTSQLTRPLADYAGLYSSEALGNLFITAKQDSLSLKLGNIEAIAANYTEKETIRVELIPGQGEVIKFGINADGKVDSLAYSGMKFAKMR